MRLKIILYYKVDGGTRVVIFDKISGIQQKVVGEGTHFKVPFIQVGFFI
jgi:prohibitin 1